MYPEFPTGNGQIDLLIKYEHTCYGIELKSYTNEREHHEALAQAARYGKQLGLSKISLVSFVEYIPEEARKMYDVERVDKDTGVTVMPMFVETDRE